MSSKAEENGWRQSFRGKLVCSNCLDEKDKDEIEQVEDGRSFKYVCKDCREGDSQ